jgi:hypothetical protein
VLIAFLVLAILAAGGFAVYKFVLNKKTTDTTQSSNTTTPPPNPEPPAPPPVETQKLAVEQPAAEDIKTAVAGTVAVVAKTGTVVKAGDVIVRFAGYKPLEADLATIQKALDKATKDLETAQAGSDAKKTAAATKAQADQQAKLATKQAAYDKLVVKAPAAGTVETKLAANAKVAANDTVAQLTREPMLVATFAKAENATADAPVILTVKGTEQKLACTVAQAGPEGTKVACPKDAASEGAEVIYAGVDASRQTAPATGSGDAAGSAAPAAGSGDAAGSAAPAAGSGDASGSAAAGSADATGSAAAAAEKPAEKKASRPRPRPQAKPPVDKPADKPAETPPADKPAETPAPAPSE